jgi:hypothetical protein
MKLLKTASGKTTVKMSKSEWTQMGKKAGWIKEAEVSTDEIVERFPQMSNSPFLDYVTYCIDIEDLESMAKKSESRDLGDNEMGINKMHLSLCEKCQERLEAVQKIYDEKGYVPKWMV